MKSDTNWQSAGFGLLIIAIIGWIILGLFHEINQAPWQFITVLIGLLGALIAFASNLHIQIRNEQKPKKVNGLSKPTERTGKDRNWKYWHRRSLCH